MHKNKAPSTLASSTSTHRIYLVLVLSTVFVFIYWLLRSDSFPEQALADTSRLPQSSLFTYLNISSQLYYNESQGILYVPPRDQPSHFVSIKSNAVRGNHRHKDAENSLTGEVIILLQGQFLFRVGDGDANLYEDYKYDISKMGIVALKFTADKCHALKNIGKQTNWFASYYIKSKDIITIVPVDKQGCRKIMLT
ncbi:unnamed protein product [Rotaria magnacalcarata]|uniref:Uncharacterized protein n=1 Tax=Rotaria magnacalcarata TaxID=392030 RepID=A0A816WB95_9BILA|nr:unnamed protein product [Rotaria magnacalcarata]CAF1349782.1 unnamed protein product [Rotaria magnacalcarata]CAF2062948.1 unnamed protein product [Rotaria magnacalcarata]CAF2132864.1 unnamed protein product [Rotaria magnacalcarata]CAF3958800.1 unnamed protein product [Rotaria magnacalcarata]